MKPSGTSQIKTLPSSEAEAIMRSLKGFLVTRALAKNYAAELQWAVLRSPVGVEDGSSVAPEQGNLIRELPALL